MLENTKGVLQQEPKERLEEWFIDKETKWAHQFKVNNYPKWTNYFYINKNAVKKTSL